MFHSPFQRKLMNLREKFFPSEIYLEEAIAFKNRLPSNIKVRWSRDGEFIIGEIIDGNNTYLAQAKSAKELVEMVNDVVYSVYGIKQKYYRLLRNYYNPTSEEFERLNNAAVSGSEMNITRQVHPAYVWGT